MSSIARDEATDVLSGMSKILRGRPTRVACGRRTLFQRSRHPKRPDLQFKVRTLPMTTLFCVHIHTKFPQGGGNVRLSKPVESRAYHTRVHWSLPPPLFRGFRQRQVGKERRVLGDRTYASSQLWWTGCAEDTVRWMGYGWHTSCALVATGTKTAVGMGGRELVSVISHWVNKTLS